MKRSFLLLSIGIVLSSFQAQGQAQDSAIYQLLEALTRDELNVGTPTKDLLISAEWEALAYWELGAKKEVTELSEAVGDLYTFHDDYTFLMKLIDPKDMQKIGLKIEGKYTLEKNKIYMTATNGKSMRAEIRLLDHNYMVLQMDGLRIFYTKAKSYFSYD